MQMPNFWNEKGILSSCLIPAGWIVTLIGRYRQQMGRSEPVSVPLICVGNLTVGGAGKTPVALDIGSRLQARGVRSHFLTRGYKGQLKGPVMVDMKLHTYEDVGDEPLLLARRSPCFVSTDRPAGARAAAANGAQVVVMDDGFQNPSIQKALSLVVVDGGYGFGNCRVIPAGPLREPIKDGLMRADAIILIGPPFLEIDTEKPILRAKIQPVCGDEIVGKRVIAFAGIGRPEKFFESLRKLGAEVISTHSFPDHHPYSIHEIETILAKKKRDEDLIVTTEKDMVRLPLTMLKSIITLPVEIKWENEELIEALLGKVA